MMAANTPSVRKWFIIVADTLWWSILAACKAVLVFQAGFSISKLSSMTKVIKEAAMMELYNARIATVDKIHFGDSARLFFEVVSKER